MKSVKDFLQSWIDWVDAGAPEDQPYHRAYGLCSSVDDFVSATKSKNRGSLKSELHHQLKVNFRDDYTFPFGGSDRYWSMQDNCNQHENQERIAWVRAKLAETPYA